MSVQSRIRKLEENIAIKTNKQGCVCIEDVYGALEMEQEIICLPEFGEALENSLNELEGRT